LLESKFKFGRAGARPWRPRQGLPTGPRGRCDAQRPAGHVPRWRSHAEHWKGKSLARYRCSSARDKPHPYTGQTWGHAPRWTRWM